MKKRIFASICLVSLASLLLLTACVTAFVYNQATRDGWASLSADAKYLAAGYEYGGMDYFTKIRAYRGRITLIAADGQVLFDDRQDPTTMDNHSTRPEVADALQNGQGQAQRTSDTLGERTLYYAIRLQNGEVLRVAMRENSILAEALGLVPWLLLVSAVIIVLAGAVARWETKRILVPINQVDLEAPLEGAGYDELAPLLRRIARQKEEIHENTSELQKRQEEFAAVTRSMDEGLIVTDGEGRILTLNQSAGRILEIDEGAEGQPLVTQSRNLELYKALKDAAAGQRSEHILPLGGRQYRLVASPAHRGGSGGGAVLLLMDETEKLEAEQTRREFSANVSHELKTPLTSISGYAEIIRGGLVQPGDIPAFAGKIYDEAARLMALIEDILQLSKLDEKDPKSPPEDVALLQLAQSAAESLQSTAAEKGIDLAVSGEEVTAPGSGSILLEVLYNLMDNAIRYGKTGGRAEVHIGKEEDYAKITVCDDGIGIPPEHQSHIFERFYRVDKSHSRQSGGTGLGLAIVKRGVLYHGGRVELQSSPGQGSTFTVLLPL